MFGPDCSVIGVVHALPLPGSHRYYGNIAEIVRLAIEDAIAYKNEGVDAILVENMHDMPYRRGYVDPETTAAMSRIAYAIKSETALPTGLQLLAGANLEALGVAVACELDFIRVEGFVYAHVGDEGTHESCAAELIRRRANLKADAIKILADVKKKHSSHAITSDVSLAETAHAAELFGADGVVVTGTTTGDPAHPGDVKAARAATAGLVLVGSGVTWDNIDQYKAHANGVIVGSSLKIDGQWQNHVDPQRVRKLLSALSR